MLDMYRPSGTETQTWGGSESGGGLLLELQGLAHDLQEEMNSLDIDASTRSELFKEAAEYLDDKAREHELIGKTVICQGTFIEPVKDQFGHIISKEYVEGIAAGQYYGFLPYLEEIDIINSDEEANQPIPLVDRHMLGQSIYLGTNNINAGLLGREVVDYFMYAPIETASLQLERDHEGKRVLQELGELDENDGLVQEIVKAVFHVSDGPDFESLDDIFGYIYEHPEYSPKLDAYLMLLNFVTEFKRQYVSVEAPIAYVPTRNTGLLKLWSPLPQDFGGICQGFEMTPEFEPNYSLNLAEATGGKQLCLVLERPADAANVTYVPARALKGWRKH